MIKIALAPFPSNFDFSQSRNSKASNLPFEAPKGIAPFAITPLSSTTSASTVGFPLEAISYLPKTLVASTTISP